MKICLLWTTRDWGQNIEKYCGRQQYVGPLASFRGVPIIAQAEGQSVPHEVNLSAVVSGQFMRGYRRPCKETLMKGHVNLISYNVSHWYLINFGFNLIYQLFVQGRRQRYGRAGNYDIDLMENGNGVACRASHISIMQSIDVRPNGEPVL